MNRILNYIEKEKHEKELNDNLTSELKKLLFKGCENGLFNKISDVKYNEKEGNIESFKNLEYNEILKHLSKLDNSKSDIGLCLDNKIFETGTSNLLFIKDNKVFSPTNKFYKGITYKFFKSKIKKIIKKDILVSSLKDFDEIILIGSGKGVASVKTINQIKWKRKNLKFYNILSRHYKSAITHCKRYS